jgi:para-nitrobenzyl esterase
MRFLNTLLSIAMLSSAAYAGDADPVVRVTGGQIKGRALPSGGAAFKGVPFAQPPVGDLRWRDPVPVKAWTGVRDAGDFGPSCAQANRPDSEEDCLSLNLWTAEWPSKSPKPVMVWLYGGGNTAGQTAVPYLDGVSLSRRGVILVTVNYRVGIFGFFAHPGLTAESPHHSSGNYGLLDQLAALKWIHENIAKFGGDPARVTLFGQSAGGIDTAYTVASPLVTGLVHRAIQESGSPIHPILSLKDNEQLGVKFAESLKAPAGATEAVKFLRTIPSSELKARRDLGPDNLLVQPIIDGYFVAKNPPYVFRDGGEMAIPIITGSNAHEEARTYNIDDMKRVIKANFGSLSAQAEEFYGLANGGTGKDDPIYGNTLAQIPTDTKHGCGAVIESIWRNAHLRRPQAVSHISAAAERLGPDIRLSSCFQSETRR